MQTAANSIFQHTLFFNNIYVFFLEVFKEDVSKATEIQAPAWYKANFVSSEILELFIGTCLWTWMSLVINIDD